MAKRKIDTTWTHERTESAVGSYILFTIDSSDIEGVPIDNGTIWIEVVGVIFSTGSPNGAMRRTCAMRVTGGPSVRLLDPDPLPAGAKGTQENWPLIGTGTQYIGDITFTEQGDRLTVRWSGPGAAVSTSIFLEMRIIAYQNA